MRRWRISAEQIRERQRTLRGLRCRLAGIADQIAFCERQLLGRKRVAIRGIADEAKASRESS